MSITEELLLENGFDKINFSLTDFEYIKIAPKKDNEDYIFEFKLNKIYSNSIGRDWFIHIANNDMQSVCACDIQTTEHFNTLMNLMEIDFRL